MPMPSSRVWYDWLGSFTCTVRKLSACPHDRLSEPSMGLTGSLRTMSLADVAQTLSRSRADGILRLTGQDGGRDIFFSKGEVIRISLVDVPIIHSLIDHLLAMGALDRSALGMADTQAQNSPSSAMSQAQMSGGFATIEALLASGRIDVQVVEEALETVICDQFLDLLSWENASFEFTEAGDDAPETRLALTEAERFPARVPLDMLLMDSVRRLDEYHRIRCELPTEDAVLVVEDGREDDLARRSGSYPARCIVPLINGVNSLGDLVTFSVCTRVDVYTVVHSLLSAGVIRVLNLEEMQAMGHALMSDQNFSQAATLYRRVLAFDSEREEVRQNLATCLEAMGDSPEAASSFAQLAIARLQDGAADSAIHFARRSCQLQPGATNHLILVRCLINADHAEEAVAELLSLARRQEASGHVEEARATCLKAMEIVPESPEVVRELSRLHATSDGAEHGVDTIVCVECGQANPRSREQCSNCGATLHLSCLHCGRVVGVSDRICIFCGNNPHVSPDECQRRAGRGPGTTAIVSSVLRRQPDPDSERRGEVEHLVSQARALEGAGRYQEALDLWKTLDGQEDNRKLRDHIRDIECLVHDQTIEQLISRGHILRERRAFFRAVRCYRAAAHGMAPSDPRVERLQTVIAATVRSGRLAVGLYACAAVILLVVAFLVAEPWFALRRYRMEVNAAIAEIAAAHDVRNPMVSYRAIAGINRRHDLQPETLVLDSRAQEHFLRLNQHYRQTVVELAEAERQAIEMLAERGQWQAVQERAEDYLDALAHEIGPGRIVELATEAAEHLQAAEEEQALLSDQPRQLEALRQILDEGRWARALEGLKQLVDSPHQPTALEAQNLRDDLLARRQAFMDDLERATALMARDISAAVAALGELSDQAAGWGEEARRTLMAAQEQAREALAAGRQAWEALGHEPTVAALQTFIERHPAVPQVQQAEAALRQRLAVEQRYAQDLAAYRAAVDDGDLPAIHAAALRHHRRHGARALADDVRVPLLIDAGMPDVDILAGSEPLGSTDAEGHLLWWYMPDTQADLKARKRGFKEVSSTLDAVRDRPRWQFRMLRAPLWTVTAGGAVRHLEVMGDDLLVAASNELVAVGEGTVRWRYALGDAGIGSLGVNAVLPPWVALDGGRLVVLRRDQGISVLDQGTGRSLQHLDLDGTPIGPPVVFTSELRHGEQRMAVATDVLMVGPLAGPLRSLEVAMRPITGPIAVAADLRTLLVFGTGDGLVAIDETSRQLRWRLDLDAAHIGRLVSLDAERWLTVLDGSVPVAVHVGPQGARRLWSLGLPQEPLVGGPQVVEGRIYVTTRTRIQRFSLNGGRDATFELSANGEWLLPAAVAGSRVVGIEEVDETVHLVLFENGREQWRQPLEAPVGALAIGDRQVMVGFATGLVQAYAVE